MGGDSKNPGKGGRGLHVGGAVSNGQIVRIGWRILCSMGEETRNRGWLDVAALGSGKNGSAVFLS